MILFHLLFITEIFILKFIVKWILCLWVSLTNVKLKINTLSQIASFHVGIASNDRKIEFLFWPFVTKAVIEFSWSEIFLFPWSHMLGHWNAVESGGFCQVSWVVDVIWELPSDIWPNFPHIDLIFLQADSFWPLLQLFKQHGHCPVPWLGLILPQELLQFWRGLVGQLLDDFLVL